jgi:hypothetical protein
VVPLVAGERWAASGHSHVTVSSRFGGTRDAAASAPAAPPAALAPGLAKRPIRSFASGCRALASGRPVTGTAGPASRRRPRRCGCTAEWGRAQGADGAARPALLRESWWQATIAVYFGVFDQTTTNPVGLWRVTASAVVTLAPAGLPPEAASLPEGQTESTPLGP